MPVTLTPSPKSHLYCVTSVKPCNTNTITLLAKTKGASQNYLFLCKIEGKDVSSFTEVSTDNNIEAYW